MDMKLDFDKPYCRLCLSCLNISSKTIEISQENGLLQRITDIFRFTPTNETKKSTILCDNCHSQVNSIAEFIENVQKNQELLESIPINGANNDHNDDPEDPPEMEIEYLDDFTSISSPEIAQASISHIKNNIFHRQIPSKSDSIQKYLVCEMCERHFHTFRLLMEHFQTKHATRGYVRCCNKQFFTRKSVVNHNEVHLNPTDFMCKICQKLLPDKYTLRDHTQRHNPDTERKFECDHCKKRFHVQKDLADHINRLHREKSGKNDERGVCEVCDKTFVSKYSLMTHNRRFHLNIERPICETCGKECRSKADLTAHIKARHTETVRQKCDICGSFVKYLQKHKQIHVEADCHVKCDICGLETTTLKNLRLHMKIHSDEKPFTCPTCGAAFKRKNALEDHMSTHNGIPRHFCNFCDRTFNNSGNKSKHMKHVHAQEMAEMKKEIQKIGVS